MNNDLDGYQCFLKVLGKQLINNDKDTRYKLFKDLLDRFVTYVRFFMITIDF